MPLDPAGRELLASLAANVRRFREENRWTQEQLAEKTDMTVRQLQRIERGTMDCGVVALAKLAHALKTTATKLMKHARLPASRLGRPPKTRRQE